MRIITPAVELLPLFDGQTALEHIERCGRVCYKSEHNITPESAAPFVAGLIKKGHESVLEHISVTARIICDRGISHELVRHRLASYSQESTRYANYSADRFGNEITVIRPLFLGTESEGWNIWQEECKKAEQAYFTLLDYGLGPQEARSVLPNSLKTEIAMTADLREWRTVLKQRTSPAAHPQMKEVAKMILKALRDWIPVVFGDIREEEKNESIS